LSLLLKLNKKVSDLALYDIRGTPGVAADISHIDTHSKVISRYCNVDRRYPDTLPKPKEMDCKKLLKELISSSFPPVFPVNQA
jgi:hypothetical protein